jgi:LacI family transcriptional regulator, galactose operon repressor
LDNTFYSKIFHGFYDICLKNNCSPIVFVSDWDQEKEKKAIDQLIGMRVDGIVISPACTIASATNLKTLVKQQLPLCIFEQGAVENIDFIGFDNYSGIFDTVKMLAAKEYRKIHLVLRQNSSMASQQRLAGFHDGLKAAGISYDESMVVYIDEQGDHNLDYFQSGYENTLKILNSKNKPEVLITLNDNFALGAYHAADELNLKIPEDIAIVGYGNRDFSPHLSPPLSTLHQNLDKIGKMIGIQLFERIENKKSEIANQLIKTPLIERGSC